MGINFEEIMGYRCWEQFIKPMLTNVMVNISTVTMDGGCVLYYMNIDAAITKLEDSDNLSENMAFIISILDIDLNKLKEIRNASLSSQSRSSDSRSVLNTQLICFYRRKITTGWWRLIVQIF